MSSKRIDPLPDEVWKPIKGYERHYFISNMGRVCSIYYGQENLLKSNETPEGYLKVSLYKGRDNRETFFIHRLVAEHFLPNPHNCYIVNHKNECPYDNRASNLEWCDTYYNQHCGTVVQRKFATMQRNRRERFGYLYPDDDETENETVYIDNGRRK